MNKNDQKTIMNHEIPYQHNNRLILVASALKNSTFSTSEHFGKHICVVLVGNYLLIV